MIEVEQLRDAVQMLINEVPDPGGSIAKHHMKLRGLKLAGLELPPEPCSERLVVFATRHVEGFSDLFGIECDSEFDVMPVQAVLDRIGQARNHDGINGETVRLGFRLSLYNRRRDILGLRPFQLVSMPVGNSFDFACRAGGESQCIGQ
jgi:hypothetical protein